MKKKLYLGLIIAIGIFLLLECPEVPDLVATGAFGSETCSLIVDVIDDYGTAAFVMSLIASISGAGATTAALVGTIMTYIKKKDMRLNGKIV